MAVVDGVADGLTDEVVADRPAAEAGVGEDLVAGGAVGLAFLVEGLGDFEVISPAGEFEAVEAEEGGFLGHFGESEVGPLAGEERDGAGHGVFPRSAHWNGADGDGTPVEGERAVGCAA